MEIDSASPTEDQRRKHLSPMNIDSAPPTEEQKRKHLFFRTTCNDNFNPPFAEMPSIASSVTMMRNFETIYLHKFEHLETPNTAEKPFPSNTSRAEAFNYAKSRIAALQSHYSPALQDLESLPSVDDADADTVFSEIHEQKALEGAKFEAGQLWNEIYFEYVIKRRRIEAVRRAWYSEVEGLVREYHTALGTLLREEQKVFLEALGGARRPDQAMVNWIAMCGPRSSELYALAQLSLSS